MNKSLKLSNNNLPFLNQFIVEDELFNTLSDLDITIIISMLVWNEHERWSLEVKVDLYHNHCD